MTTKALVPDLSKAPLQVDPEEDIERYLEKFVQYSNLRPNQRLLLKAYAEDLVGNKTRTDIKISEDTGINVRTIYNYKVDPDFARANGFILALLTSSKAGQIIAKIEKALDNGSWNAGKFLLELGGVFTPKLQTQNVNLNLNQQVSPPQSFDEAVDELLIALGNQGWSAAMITERYNNLRASGAF